MVARFEIHPSSITLVPNGKGERSASLMTKCETYGE